MTRRRRQLIEDPRRPFRLRPGVRYRVVEVEGEIVVRAVDHSAGSDIKEPHYLCVLDVNPSKSLSQ